MTTTLRRASPRPELLHILTADCTRCRGLCCVGLYFSVSDGFPSDKPAGIPCSHLLPDFRCTIHSQLSACGMKGCLAFDCLGAGQRTVSGGGSSAAMAKRFPAVWRQHQTLWYLHEALCLLPAEPIWDDLACLLDEIGYETPAAVVPDDLDSCEARAGVLLHHAWDLTREAIGQSIPAADGLHFLGKNFKHADLPGHNFATALLIAANLSGCKLYGTNFLGADLRDADVRGADLSECLFLTQGQIGAARGNARTQLPPGLTRPVHWEQ